MNNQVTGPYPPPRPPLAPPTTPSGAVMPTSPPSFSRDLGPSGAGPAAPLPPLPTSSAGADGSSGGTGTTRPRRWIAAGAASALVVAVLVGVVFGFGGGSGGRRSGSSATATTTRPPLDVPAVVDRIAPSLVAVSTGTGAAASGSGFVLSATGLVATTAMVAGDATSVQVVLHDGKTHDADVIATDPAVGVALLQVRGASGLTAAGLSETAAQVGDEVVAVGAPADAGGAPTSAEGVVSADGATAKLGTTMVGGLLQTDAALPDGAAGGPLVDRSGQVVGLSIAVDGGAAGSGYAIPVDSLRTEIQQLESGQGASGPHSPTLGASTRDVASLSPAEMARYGIETSDGAMVVEVDRRSSAHTAGLAVGDVITAVDAQVVNNTADLTAVIGAHHAGDTVTITYARQGDIRNVRVALRSRADTGN